ncbi:MAG: hypothetical protein HYT93_00385 [Parcubacteria group bacterium]|nr:hypothetical protein [Parcubacteria group bacterium]
MAKQILQDIIVPPKEPLKKPSSINMKDVGFKAEKKERRPFGEYARASSQKSGFNWKGNSRLIVWGIAALSIVVVLFAIFSLFEKATIKITPKQQVLSLNESLTAERGVAVSGSLAFEIMTLSGEEKKTLPATQVERVDKEASGKIIIYNNFDSKNQQLVVRTRFETPEGLIYRIREPVVIPGQKTVSGEKIPGSVEVTVYADAPGEKYNIPLTDFTIPGFKGTARFPGFYARSQTPMTGGFSGIVKTVSNEQLEKAKNELGASLRSKLLQKAHSQKPDEFILYNDAVFFTLDEGQVRAIQTNVDKNEVDVIVSGTLHGLIFNENGLSQFLGKILVPGLGTQEKIMIKNLDSLTFAVSNKELFSPTEDTVLSFVVQGNPHVVWEFDPNKLQIDTAKKSKEEFKQVLTQYPSIQKAEVVLRPFWRGSFPDDPKDIDIETIIEE